MRISGLTVQPTPEDTTVGLAVADDFAAELKGEGLDLNWNYPASYGDSDPSDNSNLTPEMAGPFKKLLFIELCGFFGKEVPSSVAITASKGKRALENLLVFVPDAQSPPTLPIGSGNEWDYRDRTFYSEPPNNKDADYVFNGDILNYSHDFSSWLVDETLVSVTWKEESSGIVIGAESFTNTVASAELMFAQSGGYFVTITATKTNSTDVFTVKKNFVVSDPAGMKFNA